ncbi:MAG: hypothetical protein R2706_02750 [Acidimicrobiales bacterium]
MAASNQNELARRISGLADGILPYLFVPIVCTGIWLFAGRGVFWPIIVWAIYAFLYRRRMRSAGQ